MSRISNEKMKLPQYGFKVKLNHVYPECWNQNLTPRWDHLLHLIPLAFRFLIYSIYVWWKGRKPLMDFIHTENGKQKYGVPLGGIGSGSMNRGFKGEFCRYQLRPGYYQYETIHGNQFILCIKNLNGDVLYQKVLSLEKPPFHRLRAWDWSLNGENADYIGLYPRSWTVFDIPEQGLRLICKQISPVIPNNYKDSCLPGCVFAWHVENKSDEVKVVSLTFTFQNGIGDEKEDKKGGCYTQNFRGEGSRGDVVGALIHHSISRMNYTFGIAAYETNGIKIDCLKKWNPLGSGQDVWEWIARRETEDIEKDPFLPTNDGEQMGSAVCGEAVVSEKSSADFEFTLVWDLPEIHFGQSEKRYFKYYTRFFGRENNGEKLAIYSLENHGRWEEEIEKWQETILSDSELPDWYKSAIFNETYFVSDGGTIWLDVEESEKERLAPDDPRVQYGHFAYLEGHEYRMYNTYDVHFYASFSLALLWPKLQAVLQRDFCDTVPMEDRSRQWHLFKGDVSFRKVKMTVPHDLGDPYEEPFLKINAYPIHDVSKWRDLNLKFVLQSYRDYSLNKDVAQLKYLWKNVCALMNGALLWDKDGDGLIENQGEPDQTYDTWTMTGPSSYCGSLWLAALRCTQEMAKILRDEDVERKFTPILEMAAESFEKKLWNGEYYNFDCSKSAKSRSIMSDQLCGIWYLECCGLRNQVLPHSKVMSSLNSIYKNNVLKFHDGCMGAVNGMMPDGKVDTTTIQSEEIWTGVVYALASLMIHKGMTKEAWKTAGGIYETVYNRIGMGFETPEALQQEKKYRAIGYMRPLSIWSVQLAWQIRKRDSDFIESP